MYLFLGYKDKDSKYQEDDIHIHIKNHLFFDTIKKDI